MRRDHLAFLVLDGSETQPEARAVSEIDRHGVITTRRTYAGLRSRCCALAAALQDHGPSAPVVLLGLEGAAFADAFFACMLAGRRAIPLRAPRHARDAAGLSLLSGAIEQTQPSLILCRASDGATLAAGSADLAEPVARGVEVMSFDAFAEAATNAGAWRPPAFDGDAIAYYQFTSGSTFRPHGIPITHRNALANLALMRRVCAQPGMHVAGWLPMHHDMGLVGHLLLPLSWNGSTTLLSPATFLRDPLVWLRAFAEHDADTAAVPTFALDLCVKRRAFDDAGLDLSGWRYMYVGSETVHPQTLARFADAFRDRGFHVDTFRPSYGLAESTLFVAGGVPSTVSTPAPATGRPLLAYRTHDEIDVRIVDAATKTPRPEGESGEIWIAGESVADTHRDRIAGDERAWTRTGDVGFRRGDDLFIAGRLKDILIVRGTKLAADDLEYTMRQSHEALRAADFAACFAVERESGEALVAVQEVDRQVDAATRDAILSSIRAALLEHHDVVAAHVLLIAAGTLPRTANGKVARWQCRTSFLENRFAGLAVWSTETAAGAAHAPLDAAGDDAADDPVVIVGMACRFPGADDVDSFWRLVRDGGDAITDVPADRWDNRVFFDPRPATPGKVNTRSGGFVSGIGDFDATFFGIGSREAAEVDPQQRLLVETAWRLFEDAGLSLDRLEGSSTGVFVGISTNDYLYTKIKLTAGMETFNAYSGLGNANSIAANRLSFLFDLRGPSFAVDTACSSSLTAFHLAVESVRRGECDAAIAGGANAILSPGPSITLSQFGMMAPDGHCKTFDASADGYVRAEGCGLVLLTRRSAARRDGLRILAVVRGTGIGQDGRTAGITAPNGAAQLDLLRRVARQAGIEPAAVGYVEAHGTGTAVGDPVEIEQIKQVYGALVSGVPCHVGSVKANIGHLEAAAGIASVIKTVLVLRHGEIPPQIHLRTLNPRIDIRDTRLRIPTQRTDWPRGTRRRLAAVSSFGFGGANAHVLLEEEPATLPSTPRPGARCEVFALSAKSDEALQRASAEWVRWLDANPEVSLETCCAAQALGRTAFPRRIGWIVRSRAELREALDTFGRSIPSNGTTTAGHSPNGAHKPNGSEGGRADALLRAFMAGENVQWNTLYARGALPRDYPGHPFIRQRYWIDGATPEALSQAHHVTPSAAASPTTAVGTPTTYEVRWVPRPLGSNRDVPHLGTPAAPEASPSDVAHWIIVGDGEGLAVALIERIHATRAPVFWISKSGARHRHARCYAAPAAPTRDDYHTILSQILNTDSVEGARDWRVLHIAATESTPLADTTASTLDRDQRVNGVVDVLALVQAAIACGRVLPLWISTRRAEYVNADGHADDGARLAVAQAPLWGFGKTLFLEHPELRGGLIDFDEPDPNAIIRQALDPESEHAVAFRHGQRYVAQLVPREPPGGVHAPAFSSIGAHVITGGLGGLGLRTARWLADRGARDLVLVGRHPPGAAAIHEIAALEATGARVEIVCGDVRDAGALAGLWARLDREGRSVRGVVHAAGVNWFGKIRDVDLETFQKTLAIKIDATWALHELTRDRTVDYFLMFSSVSALWGSVDLAHYTAANHFLDALSHVRHAAGLPACAIAWGPWADVGMSARANDNDLFGRLGLRLMPPDVAVARMEECVASQATAPVIADIDWTKFQRMVDFSLSPSFFAVALPVSPESPAVPVEATARATPPLSAVSNAHEARQWLESTVRRALGAVMLVNPGETIRDDQRFNLLGMDSLMAIAFADELERVFKLRLPNTLAYNYPTISAVVQHIGELLAAAGRIPAGAMNADATAPARAHGETASAKWYLCDAAASGAPAAARLLCFPYAGAGAAAYEAWSASLGSCAQLVRVQWPGREERRSEPPIRSVSTLVSALADQWSDDDPRPVHLFGHSIGAIVAFELARELRRRGRPAPAHVFLSGCGVPRPEENLSLHAIPDDDEFIARITAHLGNRSWTNGQRELVRSLVPLLRADLELLETYRVADEPPLDCPITVFVGDSDPLTPREKVMPWSFLTRGDFALRRFAGGHDFVRSSEQQVVAAIRDTLREEPR